MQQGAGGTPIAHQQQCDAATYLSVLMALAALSDRAVAGMLDSESPPPAPLTRRALRMELQRRMVRVLGVTSVPSVQHQVGCARLSR